MHFLMMKNHQGVTSFDGDTTFKRVEGEMNEWELTIFAKIVQRAASLVRTYINGASTDFFELLFDELQRVKLKVTGKPMPFKKIVRGGNLLVMNADMDTAQIIDICTSVMKYNDPEDSGIPNDTLPEKVAPHFDTLLSRILFSRPVHDFRSLVSPSAFDRLSDFVYMRVSTASSHLYWWSHKEMHERIIPCLVKSQSLIPADIWDSTPSTTNTNEAQHHWTNSLTGTKLSPVEALESVHIVDQKVAEEIEMAVRTGVLANSNNDAVHRMSRNYQRRSTSARKVRESREASDIPHQLQVQIEAEVEKHRESNALSKTLKEQLKAAKGTSGKGGSSASSVALLSASSSGRVRSAPVRTAAPTPILSTQSDETSSLPGALLIPEFVSAPPAGDSISQYRSDAPILSTQSDQRSSVPGAPLIPEFISPPPAGNLGDVPNTFPEFNFAHSDLSERLLGLFDFNALIPASAPVEDPLQDLMNSWDISSVPDFGTTPDFPSFISVGSSADQLPLLLPTSARVATSPFPVHPHIV
ncbi:hypothetical protein B0H11DRAFT_2365652 [Mycena galericulata]|nr:hypothetical protein B0H11DRAFT_2365652 [Mycena galericulata]